MPVGEALKKSQADGLALHRAERQPVLAERRFDSPKVLLVQHQWKHIRRFRGYVATILVFECGAGGILEARKRNGHPIERDL